MPRNCFLLLVCLANLPCLNASGQSLPADTSVYMAAKDRLIQLYADSAKDNLRLYNGTEFTAAYKSSLGHPFFESAEAQQGSIFYDGIFYPDVKLFHDIIRDEVIFLNEFKNLNVKLIAKKISWFTLQQHVFVYLSEDSNTNRFPGRGFYEQLYKGNIAVFKKSRKRLYEPTRQDESARFVQDNWYYALKGNTFYPIHSKRSLLALCNDRKSEIVRFNQKEGLNFKRDPDAMITRVIDHYLKLKN